MRIWQVTVACIDQDVTTSEGTRKEKQAALTDRLLQLSILSPSTLIAETAADLYEDVKGTLP